MELLCLKCRRLTEEETCPFCGSVETREPAENDDVYLAEMDWSHAEMFMVLLNRDSFPFRTQITVSGGKYRGPQRVFYVPWGRLEEADAKMRELSFHSEHRDGLPPEEGSETFDGDEIDRMESADLDDLSPEELKAYRKKVVQTLKTIREQEKLWKERTIRLMDMKEEIEYMLDE